MHETPEQTARLQTLIDRSYETAGEHLLSIHIPEWRLGAAEICEELQNVCVLDLATVSPAGKPVVAPVDGLFLHGQFWFGSSQKSQRFHHIRRNNNISAAHTRGEELSILIHGLAHEIDTATGEYDHLREYCREVYGQNYDSFDFWGKEPFAWIEAQRMYAIRIPQQKSGSAG